jgi:hypothetical protein
MHYSVSYSWWARASSLEALGSIWEAGEACSFRWISWEVAPTASCFEVEVEVEPYWSLCCCQTQCCWLASILSHLPTSNRTV